MHFSMGSKQVSFVERWSLSQRVSSSVFFNPPFLPAPQLKTLTVQQLEEHMSELDKFMDQELEALR